MTFPLQTSFHGMDKSPALERRIRQKAEKLGEFYDRIINCHVVVEARVQRRPLGKRYRVRVEISIPGGRIIAGNTGRRAAHEDAYTAVRDAFDAAARQLQDRVRIMRHQVKTHERREDGEVVQSANG